MPQMKKEPYVCPMCKRCFKTKSNIQKHIYMRVNPCGKLEDQIAQAIEDLLRHVQEAATLLTQQS